MIDVAFLSQENYPGEYIKMSPFNSNSYQSISTGVINTSHLTETPPPQPYEGSHVPEERTIDIFVNFKLRKITAEFPTVSEACSLLLVLV